MTRTERTYYLISGSYNLAQFFIAPIYPLFLLSRGLDLFQMNAVLATYLMVVFLFEVPTGAVADRFGRKTSFLLACAVRMIAYALYAFTRGFADCLVAETIDAIGTTLASGALDAWAVDGMRADGDHRPPDRLFARGQAIMRALIIVGGIACGYLALLGWAVPWLTCAGLFALTGVGGALLMHESRHAGEPAATLGATARAGLATVRTSPVLLVLCLLTFAAAFAGFPFHIQWQPHVVALTGVGTPVVGWLVALLNLSALAGSALGPRLLRRFEREHVLTWAALWRAAMLAVAAGATAFGPMVAGVMLQEISVGLGEPMIAAWTNEHIPANLRATVLSVRSTFFTLGGAAGLVALGLVARAIGIPAAWAVAAAVIAVMVPGYVLLGRLARRQVVEAAAVEVGPVAPAKVGPPTLG